MFSYCKHIFHFLLVAMVMGFASCTSWEEAEGIVAEAERSLVEGEIMRDTLALAEVVDALDNPIGRVIAKEKLVKAYYLMGRNMDDYYHDFSTAADYYIEADRLKTKDLILCGRINSCMGYLCKQDSCFEEALDFYERSSCAFKESENEWYYAHNLLNIAECHISLHKYYEADSLLTIAETFDIDSAYFARMVETRGLYFFERQEYDSALTYFLRVENYPRPIEARCYSYMKIMQTYIRQNNYDVAIDFAKLIITNSQNPVYRTNAYYSLLKHMEAQNNIQELAVYSHLRKDEDRRVQYYSVLYAEASSKLKAYLENPHPYLLINWCIFGFIIIILLLCIIAYALHKHKQCASHKTAELLRLQEEKSFTERELFERQIFDHSVHFLSTNTWKDGSKLREQANIYCGNIFYRLEETYHLSEQDIKICLMVLLEFSREQMANYLYVQPNTISKAKNKIAKQLGTSSAQLREFLITFLA